jgi:hypothetical protein
MTCPLIARSILPLILPALLLAGCAGNRESQGTPQRAVTLLNYPPGRTSVERTDLPPTVVAGTPAPAPRAVEPPASTEVVPAAAATPAPAAPPAVTEPAPTRTARLPAAGRNPQRTTKYVKASGLNVRAAAGTDAPVLAQLGRGERVTVHRETVGTDGQRWSRVEYRNGDEALAGWVATNFLASSAEEVPRETPAVAIAEDFASLDYTPIPKPSYEGNPKVDARAVYVSFNILSSARFDDILKMIDETELNALVIDYKDDVGALLTTSTTAARLNPAANDKVKYADISALVRRLKARNIYLIARIVVFKDPIFAKTHPEKAIMNNRTGQVYKSGDGLSWASPHDRDFRAYNLGLAREAAAAGFNEIQFDYIRFPDVPRTADLNYRNPTGASKAATIQSFLLEARRELAPLKVYIAADVFGLVTTTRDDMRIGQYWEAVSNAVDYICPMMYPSHYANRSYGLPVPDQHPYDLIDRGLRDALRRNRGLETPAGIRPWLQGFTATWVKGHINYTPAQVRAQIKAAADNGVNSYLIWHPAGRYNPAAYR